MSLGWQKETKTTKQISETYKAQFNTYHVLSGSIKENNAICESEGEHAKRIESLEFVKWVPVGVAETLSAKVEQLQKDHKGLLHAFNLQAEQLKNELAKVKAANITLLRKGLTEKLNEELEHCKRELESAKDNRLWDVKYWEGRIDSLEKLLTTDFLAVLASNTEREKTK